MSYYDTHRSKPYPVLDSNTTSLELRQQPQQALVTGENKEKTRKAVDPPPIVEVKVRGPPINDHETWLVNPFLFMTAHLVEPEPNVHGVFKAAAGNALLGSTVSSLHRLKDVNNKDGGFFVFGDISCRAVGEFRLQFNLFDLAKNNVSGEHAIYITSQVSDIFKVVTSKEFRGQMESTHLSRTFSDQGVRLRLRKEQRTITGTKRGYDGSPNPSTTSSISYNLQPGTLHERGWHGGASKRIRSDSDYSAQMPYTPQLGPNNMYQYAVQPYSVHTPQGAPTSQPEPYGGMTGHHPTQLTPGHYPYFSPVGPNALGAREYATTSHAQPQPQHYAPRRPDPSTSFEFQQVPSSLAEAAIPQQHQQPQYQTYAGPGSELPQYAYRPPVQPVASTVTSTQQLQPRNGTPYDQQYFTAEQELFSQSSQNASLPGPPLDQGVLNRGFVPPYTGQPQDSAEHQDFKDHPYPTPTH